MKKQKLTLTRAFYCESHCIYYHNKYNGFKEIENRCVETCCYNVTSVKRLLKRFCKRLQREAKRFLCHNINATLTFLGNQYRNKFSGKWPAIMEYCRKRPLVMSRRCRLANKTFLTALGVHEQICVYVFINV